MTTEFKHGTNGYTNVGCRCPVCCKAATAYAARRRAARTAMLAADPDATQHGRASTYTNWGCRCPFCREAHATEARLRRARSG